MTPAARPAEVRFYFDADVLGLAKVVARLRNDATYPAIPERRSTAGSGLHVSSQTRRRRTASGSPMSPGKAGSSSLGTVGSKTTEQKFRR